MSWTVFDSIVLNAHPNAPTIPACSQCETRLWRTMWWPMVSRFHPRASARSIVATNDFAFPLELFSSSPNLPSEMPTHTE